MNQMILIQEAHNYKLVINKVESSIYAKNETLEYIYDWILNIKIIVKYLQLCRMIEV